MGRLTKAQRELLSMLAFGPRDGITDKRIVNVLKAKRYANHNAKSDTWRCTPSGRRALAQEEGNG